MLSQPLLKYTLEQLEKLKGYQENSVFSMTFFFKQHLAKYIIEYNLPFWNCYLEMLLSHIWVLLRSESFFP